MKDLALFEEYVRTGVAPRCARCGERTQWQALEPGRTPPRTSYVYRCACGFSSAITPSFLASGKAPVSFAGSRCPTEECILYDANGTRQCYECGARYV